MKTAKKILIIEDEKALSRALELKLTHAGFTAKTVANGEDGLALAEAEKFDLVLCDLVMPKMDGFEFLEILQQKKIKVPVIILTNLSQSEDEKRVRDLGATDFFIKSNTPVVEIVEKIKTQLGIA